MNDNAQGPFMQADRFPPKESNPSVFSSYIREAKVSDQAMVTRWKVSMDGIVIYAALFSAVVTAFLIESYKSLSVDPNSVMILIMHQMSQQLAALSNQSQFPALLPPPDQLPFTADPSSVVTNAFWFLSLGLSLTCALIATLVQQWASDYITAIERRQDPEKQGRIRAFLYEGVEAFGVGGIVEATPILLHASLFAFLIGLVIFIQHTIIKVLLSIILVVCAAAYSYATICPLISVASPIRTPLTTFILKWFIIRNIIRTSIFLISAAPLTVKQVWKSFERWFTWQASTVFKAMPFTEPFWIGGNLIACFAKDFIVHCWQFMRAVISNSWSWTRNGAVTLWRSIWHAHGPETDPGVAEEARMPHIMESDWSEDEEKKKHPVLAIWSDETFDSGHLEIIREVAALNPFNPHRESRDLRALSWTLEHLTNDVEILPFLEGIPSFLQSSIHHPGLFPRETPLIYDPLKILRSLAKALVGKPFWSLTDNSERSCLALIQTLTILHENQLLPVDWSHLKQMGSVLSHAHRMTGLTQRANRLQLLTSLQYAETAQEEPSDNFERLIGTESLADWMQVIKTNTLEILHLSDTQKQQFQSLCKYVEQALQSQSSEFSLIETKTYAVVLSLCSSFLVQNPPEMTMTDIQDGSQKEPLSWISQLASGSSAAQRVYCSAVQLVACSLTPASVPGYTRGQSVGNHFSLIQLSDDDWFTDLDNITFKEFMETLLIPLFRVTDSVALQTVSAILCHPEWWGDGFSKHAER
ncbi:hypothetical protein C8J56DRAFT_937789, partial [Mycena floridula]